jgi:hypothetical protein
LDSGGHRDASSRAVVEVIEVIEVVELRIDCMESALPLSVR